MEPRAVSTTAEALGAPGVIRQRWRDVVFLHWRVPLALVAPHLPQPADFGDSSVEAEDGDPDSTLSLYRLATTTRRRLQRGEELAWLDGGDDVVAFVNSRDGHEDLWVVTNFGEPVALPDDAFVVLSSGDADSLTVERDVTVWFTRA